MTLFEIPGRQLTERHFCRLVRFVAPDLERHFLRACLRNRADQNCKRNEPYGRCAPHREICTHCDSPLLRGGYEYRRDRLTRVALTPLARIAGGLSRLPLI